MMNPVVWTAKSRLKVGQMDLVGTGFWSGFFAVFGAFWGFLGVLGAFWDVVEPWDLGQNRAKTTLKPLYQRPIKTQKRNKEDVM